MKNKLNISEKTNIEKLRSIGDFMELQNDQIFRLRQALEAIKNISNNPNVFEIIRVAENDCEDIMKGNNNEY